MLVNIPSLLFCNGALSVRYNSNRAAVTRINRKVYPQMYPTLMVFPDGSTVNIRYKDPRAIIKVCSIVNVPCSVVGVSDISDEIIL